MASKKACKDCGNEYSGSLEDHKEMGCSGGSADPVEFPWESLPWSRTNINSWTEDPALKVEFYSYCQREGIPVQIPVPDGAPPVDASGALNQRLADAIFEFAAVAKANSPSAQEETEWVDFPAAVEVDGKGADGKPVKLRLRMYPIVIRGLTYADSGAYPKAIVQTLREEIAGAEVVMLPQNAAFVQQAFRRVSKRGVTESYVQRFAGPTFAGKSLAKSLRTQMEALVGINLADGEIPGTQTNYPEVHINGVKFRPGFSYKVPPKVKEGIERMVALSARKYQTLGHDTNHTRRPDGSFQGNSSSSGVDIAPGRAREVREGFINR